MKAAAALLMAGLRIDTTQTDDGGYGRNRIEYGIIDKTGKVLRLVEY